MKNISDLNLSLLSQARVPYAWFARYAGISRITVALWIAALRRNEQRVARDLYFDRASKVLSAIDRAVRSGDLKSPTSYKKFEEALNRHFVN